MVMYRLHCAAHMFLTQSHTNYHIEQFPPTTLRHVAVLPSYTAVSGEAPGALAPLPRVATVIVPPEDLRVVLQVEQVLVGVAGLPHLTLPS